MGLMRDARDRFLPASNRTTVQRSDQQLEELARLREELAEVRKQSSEANAQVREARKLIGQLKSDLATTRRELVFEQRRTRCIDECLLVASRVQRCHERAILLAGWYGAGNTGDDLMMETMLSTAPDQLRRNVYVLMSQDSTYDNGGLLSQGAHVIHYPVTPLDVDALAQTFDAVLWGGGALVDDRQYNSEARNVSTGNLFIRLSEAMLAAGKSVCVCGVSANDAIGSSGYVSRLQRIVDGSICFSLRDAYSYDALKRAGVDMSSVTRCEDIAFANSELWELAYAAPDHTVIGMLPLYIPELHEANLAVLNSLLRAYSVDDAEIRLIPFYRGADPSYLVKLRDACQMPERVVVAQFATSLRESPLLTCSHIVTSRYHAAVIASCLGIPFTCLVPDAHRHYRNKMLHLAENVCEGYERHVFFASEISGSDNVLRDIVEDVRRRDAPRVSPAIREETESELRRVWGLLEKS